MMNPGQIIPKVKMALQQRMQPGPDMLPGPMNNTQSGDNQLGSPPGVDWNKGPSNYNSPGTPLGDNPNTGINPQPSPAPFNYEAARDDWMGGGYDVSNAGAARNSAAQWAQKHGIAYDGSDTINLPNGGGYIDILGNFGGGQGNGQAIARNWTAAGGNGPNANGGGGAPAGGVPGAGAPGGGFNDEIRKRLLEILDRANKPIGMDDPQMQAEERFAERARQEQRAAMAERAAYSGLNSGGAGSGAFESDINSGFEAKADRLDSVRGRLIEAQRNQLMNAMQMALASGDSEAARALQLQIATMDNQYRHASLGEQRRQFDDEFGRRIGRDAEDDWRYRYETGF